jgi:cell division ATPase FtsA
MNASRLEVDVYIIAIPKSNFNNLKKAVKSAGLEVKSIILNSYASSIATVNEEEKGLGFCAIDMGGDTSSFVISSGGSSIRYQGFLGVGSTNITYDMSSTLHTTLGVAESVKRSYANLNMNSGNDEYDEYVLELPMANDNTSSQEQSLDFINKIIYARVAETLEILAQQIQDSGLRNDIGAGFILTGGMTKITGIRELAMSIFGGTVRIANPHSVSGLFDSFRGPEYSTTIGLLMYATGKYSPYEFDSNGEMLYNKALIDKQKIPNDISLVNIAPNNMGQVATPVIPIEPQPNFNGARQKPTSNSAEYKGNIIPNINDTVPPTHPHNSFDAEYQPIRPELNNRIYDQNGGMPISPNTNNNQSSSFTKMWQWITQLF